MICSRCCQIRTDHKRILCVLPYLILVAAVFVAYSNAYPNAFLYDDDFLIVNNQFLRSWDHLRAQFVTSVTAGSNNETAYYRPLQTLLYTMVFQMAGLSLFAFHFLNIGLHAANACLIYKLGKKLDFKPMASFLAALLWAVHPVHAETIAYVSATADSLYSFLCLLGVLVLLPDFTSRRMLAAASLMLLGLLSKEAAVTFPLLAMSCYFFLNDKRFDPKSYFRFWPLVVMSVAYVALRFMPFPQEIGEKALETAPPAINYGAFAVLPQYLRLLLIPTHLHMGYDLPLYTSIWHASVLGGIGLFVMATVQILREQARRSLPLSWGLCWFIGALMPTLSSGTIFYEHWMYLPSAGLFLGAAQSLALAIKKLHPMRQRLGERGLITTSLLITLLFSYLTYKQNFFWSEPIAMYSNIVAHEDKAVNAHNNLGVIYAGRSQYEKALENYRIAIKNSNDTNAEARTNMAITLLILEDGTPYNQEALTHLLRALAINPNFYPALDALSSFYSKQGDLVAASIYRRKADDVRQKLQDPFGTISEK